MKNAQHDKVLSEYLGGKLPPWLLGHHPPQQRAVSLLLRNSSAALGGLLLIQMAAALGLCRAHHANLLSLYLLAGVLSFYLLLRFGMNRPLAHARLMWPRKLYTLGAILLFYVWGGAARDCALLMLVLLPMAALASLSYRQLRALIAMSLALLALVMIVVHAGAPSYPGMDPAAPDHALLTWKFAVVASAMWLLMLVGRRVERIRHRLSTQKAELTGALGEVRRLGQIDALTGLSNRRHMLELLHRELQRQARGQASAFCLAMIDVDHFKRVNDEHGHAVGDQVLRGFAQVARQALRVTDVVARWGGEEFLVLLPLTELSQAHVTLDRLRQRTSEARLVEGRPHLRVTISAGLAQHETAELLEALLARVDQALYAAKASGRNALCAAAPSIHGPD